MGADQDIDWRQSAASALAWWCEAGVDTLVEETPRAWLAPPPAPAPREPAPAMPVPSDARPPANLDAFALWRVGPNAPDSAWDRPIAPQGRPESGLMILIDMPEREDALEGRLLGGKPGALFDRMLAAIGRDRESVYLASLAAARPVSGQIAAEFHQPLTSLARHHIGLVAPKRLLLLGNAASRALLGANVAAARGSLHVLNHDGGQTEVVASFHPRFLLQQPARKAEAWRDLQMLIRGIDR